MPVMITELGGCSDLMAARLAETGIFDAAQLLRQCGTPGERRELASSTELEESALLALANRADLCRVRGVAGVYADLLERAGVDTVRELAVRRPDHLFEKLMAVNSAERITGTPPTRRQVEKWVEQARGLGPALSY